jgi:hypothetical protein
MATATKRKRRHFRIRGEKTYFSDVDQTLILMDEFVNGIPPDIDQSKLIKVNNNKNKPGAWVWAMPHYRHIEFLRQMAARGFAIIVWSAGGEDWADYIAGLVGIDDLIDATCGKPDWYADDKTPASFMQGRVYLDPFNPSKDLRGWAVDAVTAGVDPDDVCDAEKNLPKTTKKD